MISLVPSESWGGFKWVRASARNLGAGLCPAQSVWQGSGFAADQTNAMLAVVRADDESPVPPQAAELALSVARPLPTETALLGFGGSPVGEVIKLPFCIFSAFLCGGGITTLRLLWLCRNNPARGLFRQKNGFLRVGALRRWMRAVPSCTQCFFGTSVWGVVSLPSACASCR